MSLNRIVILLGFLISLSGRCDTWLASGGFGLTFSPTLVLLSPQLEYPYKPRVYVGPLLQLGIGDATLFTGTGTVRYLVGDHPKFKPCFEGGLGVAAGGSSFSSSMGVHILLGMGFDYQVEPDMSVGTVFRANFAPPLKTFIMSWPLIVARFRI